MIHFFPCLRERIDTGKTCEEIYGILNSVTDSRKFIWIPNAEFTGTVSPTGFRIIFYSGFRNSFSPLLAGTVSKKEEGSVIEIVLQLHLAVRIFITVWSGGVFLFFLLGVLNVLADFVDGSKGVILILISTVMIAGSQLMMRVCFYGPARMAIERLRELLC